MFISSIIIVSFLVLSLSFNMITYNYFLREKEQTLKENAEIVVDMTKQFIENYRVENGYLYTSMLNLSVKSGGYNIIICDQYGNIIITSGASTADDLLGQKIDSSVLTILRKQGEFSGISTIGGLLSPGSFVVARPVLDDMSVMLGSVYLSTSMHSMTALFTEMFQIFFITAAGTILIMSIFTYFASRRMLRPIRAVANAAKRFSHGDLAARVNVTGDGELADLAISFNQMSESLEKTENLRREFIANVSHELRTPMTTVSGFVDGMLDGTIPQEEYPHYLEIVSGEAARMSRLVSRCLEITRLDSGKIELHKDQFDLCTLIRHVADSLGGKAGNRRLSVELDLCAPECIVDADSDAITQVVYNLLDNAIKFATEDSVIYLRVRKIDRKYHILIENSGPTIPADDLPHVFDRFHKADKSRGRDRTGLGLGLFIVKSFLNAHGEDVSVRSCEGVTTFEFTMTPV